MSNRTQKAQLALGAASFVLLIALTWRTLAFPRVQEGRHEIQHTIEVRGELVTIITRTLLDEDVASWLMRHKDVLERARQGD